MRDKLLPTDRVVAIQEEIAGFLHDQVVDPKKNTITRYRSNVGEIAYT